MKTSFVLLDFENVQPKDFAPLRGRAFQVRVFCGANQNKIPVDIADQLQSLGPEVKYVRIQGTGRNALDFHIAYYIGRLSAQFAEATFYIISKDKGFEPLIKHLAAERITCHLLHSLTALPVAAPNTSAATDRVMRVADALLTLKEARPRKVKTLAAFIKGQLNNHATDAAVAEVISRLTRAGMSTTSEGKLTWPV